MVTVTKGLPQTSIDVTSVSINVERALVGQVDINSLTHQEQEEYFDRMESLLSGTSPHADAFFKNMRENIGGVGMDEDGNIIVF